MIRRASRTAGPDMDVGARGRVIRWSDGEMVEYLGTCTQVLRCGRRFRVCWKLEWDDRLLMVGGGRGARQDAAELARRMRALRVRAEVEDRLPNRGSSLAKEQGFSMVSTPTKTLGQAGLSPCLCGLVLLVVGRQVFMFITLIVRSGV